MPRVLVQTDEGYTTLSENISNDLLADDYFAVQLVERISWAVHDAAALERDPSAEPARRATPDLMAGVELAMNEARQLQRRRFTRTREALRPTTD